MIQLSVQVLAIAISDSVGMFEDILINSEVIDAAS